MSIFYLPPPRDVAGRTVTDHHNLILNDAIVLGGFIEVQLKTDTFSSDPLLCYKRNPIRGGLWRWEGKITSHWYKNVREFGHVRDTLYTNLDAVYQIGRFGKGCITQALIQPKEYEHFGKDEWDRYYRMGAVKYRFLIEFMGSDAVTVHDDMVWG